MFDWFDKLKEWFYAIPIIAAVRTWHSKLPRWLKFPVNWFVAHPAVCLGVTGIGSIVGWVVYLFNHNLFSPWLGSAIAAGLIGLLYLIGETIGFIRNPKKWWDNLGDLLGPIGVFVWIWSLRP